MGCHWCWTLYGGATCAYLGHRKKSVGFDFNFLSFSLLFFLWHLAYAHSPHFIMFISPTASCGSPNHNHDSNIVSEFLYLQFLNIVYDWINEQCPYFLFLWYPLGSVPNSYMMILITSNLIISQLLPSFDGFTLHFTIVMGPHGEILLNNQLSLQIEFIICTCFFFFCNASFLSNLWEN